MNKETLKKYIKNVKKVGLTDSDRSSLRASIQEHINNNSSAKVNVLWVGKWKAFRRLQHSALGVAMLLFMLGGVSLAAEGALPGDLLYPVKTNINEKFMQLAAMSPSSEAETESELTARRIRELQALADQGDLNESISEDLTAEITRHVASARDNIKEVSETGARESADSLKDKLSATLGDHEKLLDNITITEDGEISITGTKPKAVAKVVAKIQKAAKKKTKKEFSRIINKGPSAEVSVRSGGSVSSSTPKISAQSTQKLLALVGQTIKKANNRLNAASSTFASQSEEAAVRELLQESSAETNAASVSVKKGNYAKASSHIWSGLMKAHVVLEIINSQKSTKIPIEVIAREFLSESESTLKSSSQSSTNESAPEDQSTNTTTSRSRQAATTTSSTSSESLSGEVQAGATTSSENQPLSRRSSSTSDVDVYNKNIESTLKEIESVLELPDRRSPEGSLLPSGVPVDGVREKK